MSDTARSALKKLKAHFAKGENLRLKRTAAQKHLRTILSEIHDLRSELEEVRAEREAIERQTVPYTMYDALRRQRDRLREALREAKNELRVWPGEQLTVDHVQAARDRLSEAFDSREDEEVEYPPGVFKRDCSCKMVRMDTDGLRREYIPDCDCPVHADARSEVPSAETINGWLADWSAGPADDYYGSLGKYLHDMIVRYRSRRLRTREEEESNE